MRRRKMHPITKGITWFLVFVFVISGCCLDSASMIFVATGFGSIFGLALIAWLHGYLA